MQEIQKAQSSGIMIDFDRYQYSSERQFTMYHFNTLIYQIFKILATYIDFSPYVDEFGEIQFHVFVIKKPRVTISDKKLLDLKTNTEATRTIYKDGFHVLIPELMVFRGITNKRTIIEKYF